MYQVPPSGVSGHKVRIAEPRRRSPSPLVAAPLGLQGKDAEGELIWLVQLITEVSFRLPLLLRGRILRTKMKRYPCLPSLQPHA
jgi:hypothetical protein